MPAVPAGGPYTLSVSGASGSTTLKDIMIGDVYLCGGQSNMEYPLRLAQQDLKRPVAWNVVTPKTAGEASAACYYMARTLQYKQKVPVGFIGAIGATWGEPRSRAGSARRR